MEITTIQSTATSWQNDYKNRKQAAVISTPYFAPDTNIEQFYYNLLVQFKPFRREEELSSEQSSEELFGDAFAQDLLRGIPQNRLQLIQAAFNRLQILNADTLSLEDPILAGLRREAADLEVTDPTAATEVNQLLDTFDPCEAFDDLGETIDDPFIVHPNNSVTQHLAIVTGLKAEQGAFFARLKEILREQSSSPGGSESVRILAFITGAGGTGKSHLLRLAADEIRFRLDINQEHSSLLIAAPTGVAAKNVGGLTLHRAFRLPVERGRLRPIKPLDGQSLSDFRHRYQRLKWVIIDEISMVPRQTLLAVHHRLLQVFPPKPDDCSPALPFAGLNILLFGDVLQLKPVNGN